MPITNEQQGFAELVKRTNADVRVSYANGWLVIGGNVHIILLDEKITKLPKKCAFRNNGNIRLSNNEIEELPDDVIFQNDGHVYLYDNAIEKLPDAEIFQNDGDVFLSNNKIVKLSKKNIFKNKGGVYFHNNEIEKLPDAEIFQNDGDVYLNNNKIKKLPSKCIFRNNGYVYLDNNKIKRYPKWLSKIKYLYLFEDVNWNDIPLINRVINDELTAEEVFSIPNAEHRRIAYEHMSKIKMKALPNYRVLDECKDSYDNSMKIIEFNIGDYEESFRYLNCVCPSTGREYFIETRQMTCNEAKSKSFGLNNAVFEVEY